MKYRVLSIVSLALVLIVGSPRDSVAQLDCGYYLLLQISAGGNLTTVGELFIESNLTEHWSLYPDADSFDSSASLEISPRRSSGAPSRATKARYFRSFQQEIEIEPRSVVDWLIEPGLDDEVIARAIWQRGPLESDARLVGVLYTSSDSSLFTHRETWILDEGYVYPSLNNGMRTELRPIFVGRAMVLDEVLGEVASLSFDRVITVDFVEVTADSRDASALDGPRTLAEQSPACSASNGSRANDPLGAVLMIVVVMALRRRTHNKRG